MAAGGDGCPGRDISRKSRDPANHARRPTEPADTVNDLHRYFISLVLDVVDERKPGWTWEEVTLVPTGLVGDQEWEIVCIKS